MIEIPKIVHDRLRTDPPAHAESAKAHPDADLLAGFAEQALSGPEREGVLAHLALCETCREVVALALPAADTASASSSAGRNRETTPVSRSGVLSSRKPGLLGPVMRWTALAAAVVVVASVLLIRPGKLNGPTTVAVNPQVATLSSATSSNATPATSGSSTMSPADDRSDVDQSSKDPSRFSSATLKQRAVAPDHATSENLLASNRNVRSDTSVMSLASNASSNRRAKAAHTANKTVEVSGANVAPVESRPSGADNLLALNDALPIQRAKPAPQEPSSQTEDAYSLKKRDNGTGGGLPVAKTQGPTAPYAARLSAAPGHAFASNSTWVVKSGILQRSLDDGQNWQEALRADHPLSCYLNRGTDVWAGGQAGTLFHSADGGFTWSQVRPSIGTQSLSSDIASIAATEASAIEVFTSANERWTTMDGGKTWAKK